MNHHVVVTAARPMLQQDAARTLCENFLFEWLYHDSRSGARIRGLLYRGLRFLYEYRRFPVGEHFQASHVARGACIRLAYNNHESIS